MYRRIGDGKSRPGKYSTVVPVHAMKDIGGAKV
jgi:hypothetical protein